ncbi:toll-like receptor 3 [Lucilia cuprina]|uniref:toll-like receptor 3 n=1 Tax=Lucilia cuprina TaxID=7375 RepID=UPI001F05B1EF|nr:toll-like receptor 3 [Lucilia cuprina]
MKWFFILTLIFCIKICITATFQYRGTKTNNRKNLQNRIKRNKYEYDIISSSYDENVEQQQQHEERERHHNHRLHHDDDMDYYKQPETEVNINSIPAIEIDMPQCPQGCVCQYAHFMDLPISRWINYMQQKYLSPQQNEDNETNNNDSDADLMDNESSYEGDYSYLTNPFIKQATCIIQEDTDAEQLIKTLPHDMQALILLYTGVGKNKTVNSSILKPLNQLTTLEIRGPQDRGLRFLLDAPLSFLQHANFESITLIGSEIFKKPKNLVHPKEVFDYKPNIELLNSLEFNVEDKNIKPYDKKLLFELQQQEQEELEIVPYEVYKEEVKKSQMPSFYGWKQLEVLRIQSCGLNELSWEMFMGLEELQHLSLERNDIAVVPPFALSGATQLKTLSLAHNNINDLHYRNLAGLFELQVLDLSDNYLTKLTELSFPPLPKLERIDFRYNPIRYIFPATFWVMNQTQEMYFGSTTTALELWGNQPFKKLTRLRILEINNVTIQSLDQNIFKDLTSLEKLKLRGQLGSVEFDAFAGFSELKELDLSNCHIKDISMDAFMGCKNLKVINLSTNNISYIPPGLFDDQQSLEEIYLNDNQLKALPITFFQQKRLLLARLNNNPWKCSCEMMNWKAKITNQEKAPPTERCINDYFSGKKLSCRNIQNFKFNKKLAPRCNNFKGRSVYYVMRKQMQCNQKYIDLRATASTRQKIPHWQKIEERKQRKSPQNPLKTNSNNHLQNRMMWQLQKEEKIKNTLKNMHENSLRYQVFKTIKFDEKNEINATSNEVELSNDT